MYTCIYTHIYIEREITNAIGTPDPNYQADGPERNVTKHYRLLFVLTAPHPTIALRPPCSLLNTAFPRRKIHPRLLKHSLIPLRSPGEQKQTVVII